MLVTQVKQFQQVVQTTTLPLTKDSVQFWAKHSERYIFKQVNDYLNKLDKTKEQYTIEWLPSLNILVETKTSRKEFPYYSENT